MISGQPTEQQREVITSGVSCFVEACPGAGKTRTIVDLFVANALALPPRQGVIALSFTNVAADEIRRRCAEGSLSRLCEYPHFVGTFDSFVGRYLIKPFGSRSTWCDRHMFPTVVESWAALGVQVRPNTKEKVPPISLDAFVLDEDCETLRLDIRGVDVQWRKVIRSEESLWVDAAKAKRKNLLASGYMSCADARVLALSRLKHAQYGKSLLRALTARFKVLIVDEAQDCNAVDLEIVRCFRDGGMRTVVVADPEQAIFEFRGAVAGGLTGFVGSVKEYRLSTNFRSSQIICNAASSLKKVARADVAGGVNADSTCPVAVFEYPGEIDAGVGVVFRDFASENGVKAQDCVVLSYELDNALAAVGRVVPGTTTVAVTAIANAVRDSQGPESDGRVWFRAVQTIEGMLLKRLGAKFSEVLPQEAALRLAIDPKWLRHAASSILGVLAARPVADKGGENWLDFVRATFERTGPPSGREFKKTVRQILPAVGGQLLPGGFGSSAIPLAAMTVHGAKGKEFDAVLVVLPDEARTRDVIDAWEERRDCESRRVLYVGATRARRVLGFAVPSSVAERVAGLIVRDGAACARIRVGSAIVEQAGANLSAAVSAVAAEQPAHGGDLPVLGQVHKPGRRRIRGGGIER